METHDLTVLAAQYLVLHSFPLEDPSPYISMASTGGAPPGQAYDARPLRV